MTTKAQASTSGGTQSIERACKLLRALATREQFGWGLTELAAACGLTKPTAHRILVRLELERLVHKRVDADRYFIGPLLGEIALSIGGYGAFIRETEEFVRGIARRFKLICVMSLRSGDHFVVASRVTYAEPITRLNEVGSRRPLVSTSGGVAILVALPMVEQRRILEGYESQMRLRGHTRVDDVRAMWKRSASLGYGLNLGDTTPGTHAVAVPVLNRKGQPFASITLAGSRGLLSEKRCHELIAPLKLEAIRYAKLAAKVHPDVYECRPDAPSGKSAS